MNGWLESIQSVIATIGNFLQMVYDGISTLGNTVSDSFHYIKGCIEMLPAEVVAPALLVLVIGIVYLVLGR